MISLYYGLFSSSFNLSFERYDYDLRMPQKFLVTPAPTALAVQAIALPAPTVAADSGNYYTPVDNPLLPRWYLPQPVSVRLSVSSAGRADAREGLEINGVEIQSQRFVL